MQHYALINLLHSYVDVLKLKFTYHNLFVLNQDVRIDCIHAVAILT